MTKREWLASMNNKELGKWLSPSPDNDKPCDYCEWWDANPPCWKRDDIDCAEAWAKWLDSEHDG